MSERRSKLSTEGTPSSEAAEPATVAAGSPSLRVAVSSSAAETSRRWTWGLTVVSILCAGWLLYVLRASIAPSLDAWLPSFQRASPAVAIDAPAIVEAPAVATPEPAEPSWTYVDIELAIAPLPTATDVLIAAGLAELAEFKGLDSGDETRALLVRNRWRLWGRIWRNRVEQIQGRMPPIEDCVIHAALEPTCRALAASLAALQRIPSADRMEAAKEHFAEASEVLERLRNPPVDILDAGASEVGADPRPVGTL